MNLIIVFAVLTFVYMLILNYMYNNRDVFVLCDIITNLKNEDIHIITGVFTDQNSARKNIYNDNMYIIKITLNNFTKISRADLLTAEKARDEKEAFDEALKKFIENIESQELPVLENVDKTSIIEGLSNGEEIEEACKEAIKKAIKEKEDENERTDLSNRSDKC